MTYQLVENGRAIKCLECGMTSHNANDVRELYCGNCRKWHEELERCRFCDCLVESPCVRPPQPGDFCG